MLSSYRNIEKPILNLISAEFFIQLINSAFLSIQLIYMQKSGYSDYASAGFVSFRFLGVLLLAYPLGIYLKGRKIKNLFLVSAIGIPVFSILIIFAIKYNINWLLYASQFFWGVSFTFMQIPVLPFILRNSSLQNQTEAISLSYASYSFGAIASGLIIFFLTKVNPVFFSEQNVLLTICILSSIGIYFVTKINLKENVPFEGEKKQKTNAADWKIIFKALFPTLIIAVGAGLTIPFIGIFFFNVHGVDSDNFSIINAVAAVLVAIGAIWVPEIKRQIGYKIAIPATQSFAVLALILMATTQFFSQMQIAVYIAVLCYLIRQPLMNMAGPMTTEVVMNYVGEKNREIVSALTSAIWSGSWFISSLAFKVLRQNGMAYGYIFLITAALYTFGVVLYYLLVLDYSRKK
ncbi:MAG: MFS transporter [Bacteroidota bacterium]